MQSGVKIFHLGILSSVCIDFSRGNQKCDAISASEPSVMYGESRGRLGNHLLGYTLLLQLQRQLGVRSYINDEMKSVLTKVFTEGSIELDALECDPEKVPWETFRGHIRQLLTDEGLRKGRFLWLYKPTDDDPDRPFRGAYKPEEHVCDEQEDFQRRYVKHLKEKLKFQPRLVERASKTLAEVAKTLKSEKPITFVGIHNRRTDHLKFMEDENNVKPLKDDYFFDAMDYYREEFENVAFIYVSDDMEYGKKHFRRFKGRELKDIFFAGAGENLDANGLDQDPDAAGHDLALLASCNHTIITRGTYSLWAALLSGGEYFTEYGTIVPPDLMYS